MHEQNAKQSEGKTNLEIIAMAWANAYIQNAQDCLLDTENSDLTKAISLHATLQQRERHHIEFIECIRSGFNEISARLSEISMEADLLTKEVEAVNTSLNSLSDHVSDVGDCIDGLSNDTSTYVKGVVERLDDIVEIINPCAALGGKHG